jgi:hypothetical protein
MNIMKKFKKIIYLDSKFRTITTVFMLKNYSTLQNLLETANKIGAKFVRFNDGMIWKVKNVDEK